MTDSMARTFVLRHGFSFPLYSSHHVRYQHTIFLTPKPASTRVCLQTLQTLFLIVRLSNHPYYISCATSSFSISSDRYYYILTSRFAFLVIARYRTRYRHYLTLHP